MMESVGRHRLGVLLRERAVEDDGAAVVAHRQSQLESTRGARGHEHDVGGVAAARGGLVGLGHPAGPRFARLGEAGGADVDHADLDRTEMVGQRLVQPAHVPGADDRDRSPAAKPDSRTECATQASGSPIDACSVVASPTDQAWRALTFT